MTEQHLADVLNQYLASTNQPPAYLDGDGVFTIETSQGLLVGAAMLPDGRLELFANPGHVSAATLRDIVEDDEEEDDEADLDDSSNTAAVPGALLHWQAGDAQWGIHVDRDSGLVTLTEITAQPPWHPDGFAALLESFCNEHATWAARLEPEPPAEPVQDQMPPACIEHHGLTRV